MTPHHGLVVHIGLPPAAAVVARELAAGAVVLTGPGARAADAIRAETRPREKT